MRNQTRKYAQTKNTLLFSETDSISPKISSMVVDAEKHVETLFWDRYALLSKLNSKGIFIPKIRLQVDPYSIIAEKCNNSAYGFNVKVGWGKPSPEYDKKIKRITHTICNSVELDRILFTSACVKCMILDSIYIRDYALHPPYIEGDFLHFISPNTSAVLGLVSSFFVNEYIFSQTPSNSHFTSELIDNFFKEMLGVYNPSEIVDCMLRFPISENSLENPVEYIFEVAEK